MLWTVSVSWRLLEHKFAGLIIGWLITFAFEVQFLPFIHHTIAQNNCQSLRLVLVISTQCVRFGFFSRLVIRQPNMTTSHDNNCTTSLDSSFTVGTINCWTRKRFQGYCTQVAFLVTKALLIAECFVWIWLTDLVVSDRMHVLCRKCWWRRKKLLGFCTQVEGSHLPIIVQWLPLLYVGAEHPSISEYLQISHFGDTGHCTQEYIVCL